MTITSMPLRTSNKWPKCFGFEIFGEGPCYVLAIAKGSVAYNAGLIPGDQILQLDEQDVSGLPVSALKTTARLSRSQPPMLGVVSRLQQIELVCSRTSGFGFDVHGNKPVKAQHVDSSGPAFEAGLRQGDVILEVNGSKVIKIEDIQPFLAGRLRRLTLGIVPLGRYSQEATMSKTDNKSSVGWSRVKKARTLHDKMNDILGDDYEKKMAVISVLKQYAEDRDVEMLARALAVILKTSHQAKIMKQIRQFIPPKQRARFDQFHKHQQSNLKMTEDDNPALPIRHHSTTHKSVQVMREGGNFGFVIKGNNPVCIETVDPDGPADKAGLHPGDVILKLNGIDVQKCGHSHLVQLLQDSGAAPVIEVMHTDDTSGPLSSRSTASTLSISSASSHASSEWMKSNGKELLDKDGNTFKQRAEYLLTSKERSQMRKAMIQYDSSRNIVEFYNKICQVLDTPSKKIIWKYILAKLSAAHQEYCLNRITLSKEVLLEVVKPTIDKRKLMSQTIGQDNQTTPDGASRVMPNTGPHLTSFQQQVDYLLTSRERSQLKKALQIYAENRKVENLIQDLEVILDTPSKHTLWMYIVPLLITEHQDYTKERLHIYNTGANQRGDFPGDSYIGSSGSSLNTTFSTDDEFRLVGVAASALRKGKGRGYMSSFSSDEDTRDRTLKSGVRRARGRLWKKMHPGYGMAYSHDDLDIVGRHAYAGGKSMDFALMKELEETRKAVQEAKRVFQSGHKPGSESDDEDTNHSTKYVTVIPVSHQFGGDEGARGVNSDRTLPMNGDDVAPSGSPTNRHFLTNGYDQHKSPGSGNTRKPPEIMFTSESDSENEVNHGIFGRAGLSIRSRDSFNTRALTALKELDAAMAAEVSDLESGFGGSSKNITNGSNLQSPVKQALTSPSHQQTSQASGKVPPATPPAPPPPPPPPPPLVQLPQSPVKESDVKQGQMNVKRMNWEKLDQQKVGNTVWEQVQIGDEDLEDVVRYLELEQHFSLQANKTKITDKRNEINILSGKKAYNISILLGHLKMSVTDMKQAMYTMDETVLTPELLKQLVAFAPSSHEMNKFDCFDGNLEDLSKADQFAYEMSRVPGYEQRLKALLFKGNFNEKIEEMKENLRHIRKASKELRHSKKLTKILELILAMGNYMNKGNQRVGEAAGFKISFLSRLDVTKTKDNKTTFLHVLADAVYNRFPEVLSVSEELTTVLEAGRGKIMCMSNVTLNQELQELRKVLQDISHTLDKFGSQKTSVVVNDRFQDVMGHFISQASDEIQGLFRLQANTMEEFQSMVQYFGEDPKATTTTEIFGIFSEFINKFEAAHRHNMAFKRH